MKNGLKSIYGALIFVAGVGTGNLLLTQQLNIMQPAPPDSNGKDSYAVTTPEHTSKELTTSFAWAQLESTNYNTYVTNLRRIGCPELTIRDIIIAEVNRMYAPRIKELATPIAATGFGHVGQPENVNREARLRSLLNEKKSLLSDILGEDGARDVEDVSGVANYRLGELSFLDQTKREAVAEKEKIIEQMKQHVWWKTRGFVTPADQKELEEIDQLKATELAKILTSQELRKYELVRSSFAQGLRHEIELFSPNEVEFEAIYEARKKIQEIRDAEKVRAITPDQRETLEETDRILADKLGQDRFNELKRFEDPVFAESTKLIARLELPKERVEQFLQLKVETENALRVASTLEGNRQQQILSIKAAARRQLSRLIGNEGVRMYTSGGVHSSWVTE